jgi:betaine lipid synthase
MPLHTARFGGGVPCKQYKLIGKDKLSIAAYVARTLDGVAQNSHLRSDNYFYFNCLTGRCAP